MYRQKQKKVREYIISHLRKFSSEWEFDIDTTNASEPIIVCTGPEIIRTPIERFHLVATEEMINNMVILYKVDHNGITRWGGCVMMRKMIQDVLNIYGISSKSTSYFSCNISNKTKTMVLYSPINGVTQLDNVVFYVSPFYWDKFDEYVMKEELISPFLLLLDPVTYFRRYSEIILKYPILGKTHTFGIYEVLLEYFPEMNVGLFEKYLVVYDIFDDWCCDIVPLVMGRLIELYSNV